MLLQMDHNNQEKGQLFQDSSSQKLFSTNLKDQNWVVMEGGIYETSSSSIGEDSTNSNESSSLDTITDDASSSCSSSTNSSGSLYDLSDLMSQLPIKRGLSKFYQGKSQSFTSLSSVGSIEDLVKKENSPYTNKRKLKGWRRSTSSHEGGLLDNYKLYTLPKPIISKKSTSSKGFIISSSPSFPNRKGSFLSNSKPPHAR